MPAIADHGPLAPSALGSALRRWRTLHRVKQHHAAELLGVAQSTISRWEAGALGFEQAEAARVEALVAARPASTADAVLRQLIAESTRALHLICDVSHRLLACSVARSAEFGVDPSNLLGRSLWRFATPQVMDQEARLPAHGWHDLAVPPPLEFDTGENDSPLVAIRPSRCRWTRFALSDGTVARLVETLSPVPRSAPAAG